MDNYKTIINNFLSKWERKMSGPNYQVELGFRSFSHCQEKLRKENIINIMYSHFGNELKNVRYLKSCKSEFKKEIIKLIILGDFETPTYPYSKDEIKEIKNKFFTKYYDHMKHYINLNNANIYKLLNVPESPCFDIFWSFCYLLTDHNLQYSIVVYGGAAD